MLFSTISIPTRRRPCWWRNERNRERIGMNMALREIEVSAAPPRRGLPARKKLAALGDVLLRRQALIRRMQWVVVGFYLLLVGVPAFLPLPDSAAHVWNNLTVFAQFAFWGVWWPFVLLSMVLVGRAWCGLFCPEGALSETMSERGKGRSLPHWLTWRGWPFVAFALTTVYGQMVSVYQYAAPALLVLGGSTVAAMIVGYYYGRGKRVWCRYLCPVSGVFGLLSKLAPLHFRVDREDWRAHDLSGLPTPKLNCAALVPVKVMKGAEACHMCGRCSGFKDSVTLSLRAPGSEIVEVAGETPRPWETALIVFGLMGVAVGAFHWSASPWYIDIKQALAEKLADSGAIWMLKPLAPWWILTNYPDQNDTMSLLDGAVLLGYIAATAAGLGGFLLACLALAARALGKGSWGRLHHFAQCLIPLAGCGVFLGLSALTVTLLKQEGVRLAFVSEARALLLAGAGLWAASLAWRVSGRYAAAPRRLLAMIPMLAAIGAGAGAWVLLFWVW
jgi:polyferredoxin